MSPLQKILASDLTADTKEFARQFNAALRWHSAAIECFTERRQYRFIKQGVGNVVVGGPAGRVVDRNSVDLLEGIPQSEPIH